MTAEVKLTEKEIVQACLEYVIRQGWLPEGTGWIDIKKGYSDPREGGGASDQAEFVVKVKVRLN